MAEALILNLVGVAFAAVFLAILFGESLTDGEFSRWVSFCWFFALGFFLSFWGWVIFVAQHFIGKYW